MGELLLKLHYSIERILRSVSSKEIELVLMKTKKKKKNNKLRKISKKSSS
jgi:hypothetical protein